MRVLTPVASSDSRYMGIDSSTRPGPAEMGLSPELRAMPKSRLKRMQLRPQPGMSAKLMTGSLSGSKAAVATPPSGRLPVKGTSWSATAPPSRRLMPTSDSCRATG